MSFILSELYGLVIHELDKVWHISRELRRFYDMEMRSKKNSVEEHMSGLEYMLLLEDETADTTSSKEELRLMAQDESIDVIEGNMFFSFEA